MLSKIETIKILKSPIKAEVLGKIAQVNLTDKERETLILTFLRGRTELEAAEVLDVSRNTT